MENIMSEQVQSIIVITGGTGGIGYQSAKGIAKTGAKVFITGRIQKNKNFIALHMIYKFRSVSFQ